MWINLLLILIDSLSVLVISLFLISFLTNIERQEIGNIQDRKGPDVVGYWGLLQPFTDGLKVITKELFIPTQANKDYFILAPIIVMICAFVQWVQVPFSYEEHRVAYAVITFSWFFISVLGAITTIGLFLAGWASNSKYALLGALRSIAQMLSYELVLSLLFLVICVATQTTNLLDLLNAQKNGIYLFWPLLPVFFLFFITGLAETNRAPFDLPEGESEIVAGFHLDYSGIGFAIFFLGEYGKIFFDSVIIVVLFFGGWTCSWDLPFPELKFLIFTYKVFIISYVVILIRAIVPRYRVDQFMLLGWKTLLPLTFTCFIIFVLNSLFNPTLLPIFIV